MITNYYGIFKKVKGWNDYFINQEGVVVSMKRLHNVRKKTTRTIIKQLKHIINSYGYLVVNLSDKGRRETKQVHVLVAQAFIGDRPYNCDAMHLDNNKQNPNINNIRYGSRQCNEAFKIDYGTALIGSRHHRSKLNENKVVKILDKLSQGQTGVQIAKEYNMSPSMIGYIKRGKNWTHVSRRDKL